MIVLTFSLLSILPNIFLAVNDIYMTMMKSSDSIKYYCFDTLDHDELDTFHGLDGFQYQNLNSQIQKMPVEPPQERIDATNFGGNQFHSNVL